MSAPSPFRHQTPGLIERYGIGLFIGAVARPCIKTLERFGQADKILGYFGRKRIEQERNRNPFRGYVPGPQDVFVMTYAKSGTNWMMQVVHQLIYHGKGEYGHIHDVVPWPDTAAKPGYMRRYAIPLDKATHWRTSPEKKRVIKTHFNWDLLPYSPEARYIAVIRDPKDVFVSNYFFVRDGVYGTAMPSAQTWYRHYLSKDFLFGGSWAVNVAGYWAEQHRANVLVISFKSMTEDLRGTVRRIAQFLNIQASDDLIDEVCRLCSFAYMKTIDHKFHIGKVVPWREAGAMLRKGAQGSSAELLSAEQQCTMDRHFITELRELGSDFPYEDFCDLGRPA